MKMQVIRVESTNVSGTSKTGNPYHIDQTMVTVQVPITDSPDSFGSKEMSYQYGNSANFNKLISLKGQLPVMADIELGASLNSYGGVTTVITDIKLPQLNKS